MASATFTISDTPEARKELSLLFQIEPKQLYSHDGLITVEFPELLEDKALHVISGAVANHGFQVSIPVKKTAVNTTIEVDGKTIARVATAPKPTIKGTK